MSSIFEGHKRRKVFWLLKPLSVALYACWVLNPYVLHAEMGSKGFLSFLFGSFIAFAFLYPKFVKTYKEVDFSAYEKKQSLHNYLKIGRVCREKRDKRK